MPKIILTIGASASGKTTWAEEFKIEGIAKGEKWANLNRDEIRFSLFTNSVRDWTKYKFSKNNENKVTEVQLQKAKWATHNNSNIIISDTNLSTKARNKWKQWAKDCGYDYEEKLFPCPWETLVKRNAQRQGGLSEALLWDQYIRFERQFGSVKLYEHAPDLPDCIICDIDGTVASMEGRSPFDWSKVGEDSPRESIIAAVSGIRSQTGIDIIFLSGRDGSCYKETYEWISSYITPKPTLYMRQAGDSRKDSVIKDELYENHIRGKYNVYAVFDDRRQMIRHWTLKGMPNIFDVGSYNEEF